MSSNPLKRILLTNRSSHTPAAKYSRQPLPAVEGHAPALEEPSIEEVEALLAEGLGSANGVTRDDDAAFLDLIDEIVEDSNNVADDATKDASQADAFLSLEDTGLECVLHQEESVLPKLGSSTAKGPNRKHSDMTVSCGPSKGTDQGLVRRSLVATAAKGVKPRGKSSSAREGAEKLVSLMRSGKMPAGRVRSAISRSNQRRAEVSERSKRVKDSFLSVVSACGGQEPTSGTQAAQGVALNQPEVMRRAPITGAQRVSRMEQNVIAAKQDWESKYRVLLMVENGVQTQTTVENLDSRYVQHQEAVNAAAQKVLEASGDLLIAQVELAMAKLPTNQIYYYYDDRTRLQGPYKAAQLCMLAKLKVMPSECTVLIDLAQIGGVSVRTPSESLLGLLADPENLCQAAAHVPAAAADPRQGVGASPPHARNGVDLSDPRAGSESRSSNGGVNSALALDARKSRDGRRGNSSGGDMRTSTRKELRSETERWRDSGARPRQSQLEINSNQRPSVGAKANALHVFEVEKALEVYSFEDSEGEICGPFSFNELQEKYARGSISEPLLLMYDTDFGTTVLSVAQLFRNMTQRHEEILAANNPPPPPIETLRSCGVSRRIEAQPAISGSRDALSPQKTPPVTLASTHDPPAVTMEPLVSVGPGPSAEQHDMTALLTSGVVSGSMEPRGKGAGFADAALSGGAQPAVPGTDAVTGAEDSAPGIAQLLPSCDNPSGYSAAPPEGYGAAPVVHGGTSLVANPCAGSEQGDIYGYTAAAAIPGMMTPARGATSAFEEGGPQEGRITDLPSGFDSFDDLLHHVAENQMEPIKQRMLRIQGAQRPSLMAQLDFKALRALAEAPVHIADNAIRTFTSLTYEPQDASNEFLRCLNEQDTHG